MCPVKVTEFPLSILAGSLCEMDLIVLLILIIMIIKKKLQQYILLPPPCHSLQSVGTCLL